MKKLLAAIAAILILAGCSQKPDDFAVSDVIVPEPQDVVEELPQVTETPVEEIVVEDAEPELTEEAPAEAIDTYALSEDKLEGLVGDTIGYSFDTPVFDGFAAADQVTTFYADLAAHLEGYTKETINEQCLNNSLMASVFGEITHTNLVNNGLALEVHYEFRVEYSDGTKKINTRVDTFDIQTGEVESVTE